MTAAGWDVRTSRKIERYTALDFYRFLAAFGVAILHFNEFAHHNLDTGLGWIVVDFAKFVDFFFILSGFVIGLTAFDKVASPLQILTFLRRRLARIYPLHVVTLAIFIAPLAFGASTNTEKLNPNLLLQELLLVRYWLPHAQLTLNFPSWSISVEWAMYLLFPLLALLHRRFGWPILAAISFIGFCAVEYSLRFDSGYHGLWFLVNNPIRALPTFTLGVILSQVYDRFPFRNGVWLGMVAFALSIFAMVSHASTWIELGLFAASIWFTAAGYSTGSTTTFDRHTIFEELGNASYSMYMLHVIFLIVFVQKLWPKLFAGSPWTTYGVGVCVAVILVSICCYHWFEKPMRRWISNQKPMMPELAKGF
jgi:peptidoglycan/LPS O-acetylase OafA/YrhL